MNNKRQELIRAGEEPRTSERYATRDIAVEFPIAATVVDVSESGMGIESGQQLRVGSNYVFRVQVGDRSYGLPGKVEWCRFSGTRGTNGAELAALYKAGISFPKGPAQESWGGALQTLIDSGIEPLVIEEAIAGG